MDEWINMMCYIHAMEYFSVIKRNYVLIHSTTLINYEKNMINERSQEQNCLIPCTPNVQNRQIYSDRIQMVA